MGWGKLFKAAPAENPPPKVEEEPKLPELEEVPAKSVSTVKPKPITRTAMGEYIVPPGGKPLTILANPDVPGPANYLPKMTITKKSAPQYTIKARYKQQEPEKKPGPADYETDSQGLMWKRRTVTLKGRDKEADFTLPDPSNIGPAGYLPQCEPIGKSGPKHTLVGRQPFKIYTGPPNLMIQAVDVNDFQTPGPDYRPGSADWRTGPQKSIGMPLKHEWVNSNFPVAPATYNLSSFPRWDSPAYSLAKRFPDPNRIVQESGPAPNEYDLRSTLCETTGKSVSSRWKVREPDVTPGPNTYSLKDTVELDHKAATITYRWLDSEEEAQPGPGQYSVPTNTVGQGPAFTFRPRLKVKPKTTCGDGPAKYDIRTNFSDNDKPAFSMGKRLKRASNETIGPGPGGYNVTTLPGIQTAPEFTLAKKLSKRHKTYGPGPAQYKPDIKDGGPMHSMTRRPKAKIKKENTTPGPYRLPQGITRSGNQVCGGATFKSRASPYIYSGFRTLRLLEPLPEI